MSLTSSSVDSHPWQTARHASTPNGSESLTTATCHHTLPAFGWMLEMPWSGCQPASFTISLLVNELHSLA